MDRIRQVGGRRHRHAPWGGKSGGRRQTTTPATSAARVTPSSTNRLFIGLNPPWPHGGRLRRVRRIASLDVSLISDRGRARFLIGDRAEEPSRISTHKAGARHAVDGVAIDLFGRERLGNIGEVPAEIAERTRSRSLPMMPPIVEPAHAQLSPTVPIGLENPRKPRGRHGGQRSWQRPPISPRSQMAINTILGLDIGKVKIYCLAGRPKHPAGPPRDHRDRSRHGAPVPGSAPPRSVCIRDLHDRR